MPIQAQSKGISNSIGISHSEVGEWASDSFAELTSGCELVGGYVKKSMMVDSKEGDVREPDIGGRE
jgi:hypothetical protein